jgi:Arc/MetJ-type ribon-helix-helix transcriptional regulator
VARWESGCSEVGEAGVVDLVVWWVYNDCMDTEMMTINISMPKAMYADAKKKVAARRYASISELIRDGVRAILYPNITVNGFTKEFEDSVLKSEKEADAGNVIEWNGKESDLVRAYEKDPKNFDLHTKSKRTFGQRGGIGRSRGYSSGTVQAQP